MATDDDKLENRIREETAKIKVDSYQNIASVRGWAGGSRTFWAIATLGTVVGAAIGLVAPFFPLIVDASTVTAAISAVPASVAAFAAAGMSFGFGGGMMLGRISGTAAAVAEEQERRMKEWMIRQKIQEDPNTQIIHNAPAETPVKKSFWQRVKDTYHTYVNPRVGLAMTAIGIIGGLIMAAAFIKTGGAEGVVMRALETLTGIPGIAANASAIGTNAAALTAYSAGVMGTFGSLWFLNFPKITSGVTHFYGKLLDGSLLGREWGPKPEKQPEIKQERSVAIPAQTEQPSQPHVTIRKYESFQELVAHQAARDDAGMPTLN